MSNNTWKAELYDSKHSFVSEYGKGVVELLDPKQGEWILDLGCGTGDLTNTIAQHGTHVFGIDNSESMINKAKSKYPHMQFQLADAANFTLERKFNAVFSNAALHWIKEPENVLRSVWAALQPNGRFVAEFGGKGNVQKVIEAIFAASEKAGYPLTVDDIPWYFPSIAEYTTIMEKIGFRVVYAAHFDRPTKLEDGDAGLVNWLQMFARSFLDKIPVDQHHKLLEDIEHILYQALYQESCWYADYKRIRVIGIKEKMDEKEKRDKA